jgi:hypothetical protein
MCEWHDAPISKVEGAANVGCKSHFQLLLLPRIGMCLIGRSDLTVDHTSHLYCCPQQTYAIETHFHTLCTNILRGEHQSFAKPITSKLAHNNYFKIFR